MKEFGFRWPRRLSGQPTCRPAADQAQRTNVTESLRGIPRPSRTRPSKPPERQLNPWLRPQSWQRSRFRDSSTSKSGPAIVARELNSIKPNRRSTMRVNQRSEPERPTARPNCTTLRASSCLQTLGRPCSWKPADPVPTFDAPRTRTPSVSCITPQVDHGVKNKFSGSHGPLCQDSCRVVRS